MCFCKFLFFVAKLTYACFLSHYSNDIIEVYSILLFDLFFCQMNAYLNNKTQDSEEFLGTAPRKVLPMSEYDLILNLL